VRVRHSWLECVPSAWFSFLPSLILRGCGLCRARTVPPFFGTRRPWSHIARNRFRVRITLTQELLIGQSSHTIAFFSNFVYGFVRSCAWWFCPSLLWGCERCVASVSYLLPAHVYCFPWVSFFHVFSVQYVRYCWMQVAHIVLLIKPMQLQSDYPLCFAFNARALVCAEWHMCEA